MTTSEMKVSHTTSQPIPINRPGCNAKKLSYSPLWKDNSNNLNNNNIQDIPIVAVNNSQNNNINKTPIMKSSMSSSTTTSPLLSASPKSTPTTPISLLSPLMKSSNENINTLSLSSQSISSTSSASSSKSSRSSSHHRRRSSKNSSTTYEVPKVSCHNCKSLAVPFITKETPKIKASYCSMVCFASGST